MQREPVDETWGVHASLDDDGRAHFRAVATRVTGPPCLGLTIGWDTPTPYMLPYVTVEVFGWMVCVGWTHSFESPQLAGCERQACAVTMRRDYYLAGTADKVEVCRTHDPDSDELRPFLFQNLLEEAGVFDGDEFELLVTATGRRPHGDRRYLRDARGNYRAETDDECLERIETT